MARATIILGNGFSVAATPNVALSSLTRSFLEEYDESRDDLDSLLANVALTGDPVSDFEAIVGALESAEEVVRSFLRLARSTTNRSISEAADVLSRSDLPGLVRRLYYNYCSDVLQAITTATSIGDVPTSHRAFADWIRELRDQVEALDIFTLNYDVLLERILLSEDLSGVRSHLTDFFSGVPELIQTVTLAADTPPLTAWPFFPENALPRQIHLHHLHGGLSHFRNYEGEVVKVAIDDVRAHDLFRALSDDPVAEWAPCVVLGSQKRAKTAEWPFAHHYYELGRSLNETDRVAIIGYSFRDDAVNAQIRNARSPRKRWMIVDVADTEVERDTYTERCRQHLDGEKVALQFEGLSGGLLSVEEFLAG